MKVNEQVLAMLQRLETCITELDNSMEDIHIKLDALLQRIERVEAQIREVYDTTSAHEGAIEEVAKALDTIKKTMPDLEEVVQDMQRRERTAAIAACKPAF